MYYIIVALIYCSPIIFTTLGLLFMIIGSRCNKRSKRHKRSKNKMYSTTITVNNVNNVNILKTASNLGKRFNCRIAIKKGLNNADIILTGKKQNINQIISFKENPEVLMKYVEFYKK